MAFDEGREAAGRPCQPGPGRQAFVRLQALVGAGVRPEPADFGAVAANLDEAVRELEAVGKARPFRVLPGGRG